MGLTVLFTHLKIILLQCFQFSVFSFSKISSIQTNHLFRIFRFKREREKEVIFLFFCCFGFSLWTQSVILGYKLSIESNQPNGPKIFFTFWQIYYVPKPSDFFFPSLNLIKSFFFKNSFEKEIYG